MPEIARPNMEPAYDWPTLTAKGIWPSSSQLCARKPFMVNIPKDIWDLMISKCGDEEKAARWFWTPNPGLDGATPYRMLEAKRPKVLKEFLETLT